MALKGGTIVKTMYIAAMRAARVIWTVLCRFILEICARWEELSLWCRRYPYSRRLCSVAFSARASSVETSPEGQVAGESDHGGKQQTDEERSVGYCFD